MAAPKGNKYGGSRKGVPNKTTKEFREGLNKLFDGQWANMQEAFEEIRKDNPVQYLSLMEKYMAYSFPKKRDITSDDKPIQAETKVIVNDSATAKEVNKLINEND